MKPHFIVCGERSEPTWDPELDEIKQFDTFAGAGLNAQERAMDKPGEKFFVLKAVGMAEVEIAKPDVVKLEGGDG